MVNNTDRTISIDTIAWQNFLCEIENLQMFSLCKEFEELSLEDAGDSSSSKSIVKPSTSTSKRIEKSLSSMSLVQPLAYRGDFRHYFSSLTYSFWCQSIIEKLRAPFIEIPRKLIYHQMLSMIFICR